MFAQEPIRFTTKQGLPTNHIYDIEEDAGGFMWFATNRGLVKYDGENFRAFTLKDGLPNNDTWLLETDYQGKLWFFSKSNYQGYIKNDSIYKFPTENNKVISPRWIHKSKEKLWLHSAEGYQVLKNGSIKTYKTYKTFKNYNKKYWNEIFTYLNEKGKGYNFSYPKTYIFENPVNGESLVYNENEVFFFDTSLKLIKKHDTNLQESPNLNKINNFGFLYNQIFYIGMEKGVLFVDFKSKKIKYFSYKELVGVTSVKYFRCKGLKNEIQVSFPGHLLIFNYDLEFKESSSFPENLGRMSYRDTKGNIWLADFANGISLIPTSKTKTKTNYYLKNKKVQKINKIDNVFYAGIGDDGFYRLNTQTRRFNQTRKLKKANGVVYQIKKDARGNIRFISTANSYIKNEKGIQDLLITYFDSSSPIQSSFKSSILYKKENYFIVGDYLLKSDSNFKKAKKIIAKSGLLHSAVFKGNLYIGGSDGLHVKEKDTLIKPNIKNSLLKVSISSFLSTKDNLYVGTDGRGVYVYDKKEVIHLKNTDGFSIQKIIKKENILWLATEKGVHKVSLEENDIQNSKIINNFYDSDGLLQNNTNDIYLERDTLYAASDVGLIKLNVNDAIYKNRPKIYFKTKNDTLSFKNDARDNISITFALQDYNNQDYVNYQYRVLPTQKKWTITKTKTLNFSNLSPNVYQLEIKAIDQHFNQTTIVQYLNVLPNWWQTLIAKICFGLLVLLAFGFLIKIIKYRIQKKTAAKAEVDIKIAGLELQALRSQMNPHFVHNSLNAIQYFIQRNEVELSEDYLVKFSKLVRLFFEYSRRKTVTIAEEVALLDNYLQIEKLRFEDKLSYEININYRIEKDDVQIPSMLLQPIVENAVNHGLFHKQSEGLITIDFKFIDHTAFKVTIKDDGIGIKKAKEFYKNSVKNYQSSSTIVLEERLSLLQKSNNWEIEYFIEDLSDKKTGEGTEVNISFKQKYK